MSDSERKQFKATKLNKQNIHGDARFVVKEFLQAEEMNEVIDGILYNTEEIDRLDAVVKDVISTKEPTITTLPVSKGGTGSSSFTSGSVLIGAGTSPVTTRAVSDTAINSDLAANTNLITAKTLVNKLPKINNVEPTEARYKNSESYGIFAPTVGGNAGQVLKSQGTTLTPAWGKIEAADLPVATGNERGAIKISLSGSTLTIKTD